MIVMQFNVYPFRVNDYWVLQVKGHTGILVSECVDVSVMTCSVHNKHSYVQGITCGCILCPIDLKRFHILLAVTTLSELAFIFLK